MNRSLATLSLTLAVAASFVLSVGGSANATPTVYLEETYEAAPTEWTSTWYDADIGPRNRVTQIGDGSDGSAIKVSIPASSHFGSAMHWQFADQGIPEPDELYFRYHLRIPDGFVNHGRGKLPGPAGLYTGSARNNIKPTDASPGWSARMFFSPTYTDRDSDHTQLGFYVYHRDQADNNGDLVLWDPQPGVLRHGAWYCVEGHVAMNTPGQANGLLEGWVDENLAFYQDDFRFRGTGDAGIDIKSFWFDVYYGGNGTAPGGLSFDFDSLVLSSERIGCGASPTGGFRDTGDSVHKDNITKLAHAGITRGCNPPLNDLFCPDRSVTRGQMAAFLVRALNLPAAPTDYFTDDADSVFQADINALAASGITRGCSPTEFCPEKSVTRGQMAAFLDRALDLPAAPPDQFTDDDESIFEDSIDRLAAAGVTAGCNPPSNTNYCPDRSVTRAQMGSFLSRALDLPSPPPPPPGYIAPTIPDGFDAVVPVGWSIQEVADSQPTGARILVRSGTHLRQQVYPKAGQEFIAEPGTILDGLGETAFAFAGNVDNVTVDGFEIKHYTSGFNKGAIHVQGSGWEIRNSEVHNNPYVGVSIRGGSIISNSHIHHNDQLGILVDGGSGATVDGNEIAHNNDDQTSGDFYFAGAKFLATSNLSVTNNHVHHNHGFGLWTYEDNIGARFDGNTIEANYWAGIHHERSYAVTINDNVFRNNGTKGFVGPGSTTKYGAVRVRGPNATITGNLFDHNFNAVAVIGSGLDSATGQHGPLQAVGTVMTDNTIIESGYTGIVTNGSDAVFTTATIDRNDYVYADTAGRYWLWQGWIDFADWQSNGLDVNGSLSPL
ncbi:MAG: right-handed parallel beta-helix repeat-containing protein [Acidimicrobiia bacterium]|nr:right-handed parallel beta-helix repeat-containing protein [Acidimicrobiia bacterium]